MTKRSYNQYCGIARALDLIGERWALLVIRELVLGPKRFTDLRRGLPDIATNVLSQRLRELEQDSIVTRRQLPPPAASNVYELTEYGQELVPIMLALGRWGASALGARLPEQTLEPEWLAVALKAVYQPQAATGVSAEIRLDLGGSQFTCRLRGRGPRRPDDRDRCGNAHRLPLGCAGPRARRGRPRTSRAAPDDLRLRGRAASRERVVGLGRRPAGACDASAFAAPEIEGQRCAGAAESARSGGPDSLRLLGQGALASAGGGGPAPLAMITPCHRLARRNGQSFLTAHSHTSIRAANADCRSTTRRTYGTPSRGSARWRSTTRARGTRRGRACS